MARIDRSRHRNRVRRLLRFTFVVGSSAVLISTRLFGAAPENSLSTTFQQVIGESLPSGLSAHLNNYAQSLGSETFSSEVSDTPENLATTAPVFPAYSGVDLVGWVENGFQEGQNTEGGLQGPVIVDVVGWIESWFLEAPNSGSQPGDNELGLQDVGVFDLLGSISNLIQGSPVPGFTPGGETGPQVFDVMGWVEAWFFGGQPPGSQPGSESPGQVIDVVGWITLWILGPSDDGSSPVQVGPGWQVVEVFDLIGTVASWLDPEPAPPQPAIVVPFDSAVQTQVAVLLQEEMPTEPPVQIQEQEPPATEPLPTEVPPTEPPPTESPVVEVPPDPGTGSVLVPPAPPKPVNLPPTCKAFNYSDSQTTGELTISLSSLCSDPEGEKWELTGVTQGNNGSTRFDKSNIYYSPNAGFAGKDNITFTIVDSKGHPYTQSFNVKIANLPPVANTDTVYPPINISNYVIDVLANDTDPGNDPISIVGASWGASNGFVEIIPEPTAGTHITYTPDPDYIGPGTISYTLQDSHGATTTGTVNLDVGVPPWCGVATGHPLQSGCLVSNVRLNGVPQTTLTVNPSDTTFTLQFDFQIWSHPGTSWIMQIMPGIENTFSGTCAYDGGPGNYPGTSGTSPVITMPVPATSGSYRIFIPRDLHYSCGQATYYVHDWIETVATVIVP